MPEERVPWKESNLALIGSDLDHKIKAAAAAGEPQWDGIADSTGLKLWRIEQFRVVPWPMKDGSFHTGDSYVVLNSYTEPDSDAILHDIHIWIGAESSQDEYGTAAYKMVEADEAVGGAAIQHREVQGHESELFTSYFGGESLKYLAGGCESGFNHVEATVDTPHLYQVKGTEKGMSLTQIPTISKSSLNQGDSFILYGNNSTVFCWHGSSANPDEKARANSLAENMCTQGTVVAMESGESDDNETFWNYFEGDGEIADADEGDEDIEEFAPLLFKISADSSEQVAKGEPVKMGFGAAKPMIPKSALNDDDVFLLDAGWELFVWIGKNADRSEKISAMAAADNYAKEDPRTADLPLTLCKAGYESSAFNAKFFDD